MKRDGQQAALSGLRVIDCGEGVAAAYASRLLADLGADVIKVEPPGVGDQTRWEGPFPGDIPDPEKSGLFLYLNANKRSIELDLHSAHGRGALQRLCERADLLIENRHPDEAQQLGLSYEALRRRNLGLIVVSISPFGHTGPYSNWRGYEANCAALGGITMYTGEPGREPLNPPRFLCDVQAGIAGAVAALIAILARRRCGEGQHIDLSETDVLASMHTGVGMVMFLFGARVWKRFGRRAIGGPYPYTILPCQDGDIRLIAMTKLEWRRFLETMGNPAWGEDPRFQDRIKMQELYADELDALIMPWLQLHTKQELFQLFYDHGVPFTPIKTVANVVNDAHLKARHYFIEWNHPRAGKLTYPGFPYRLSRTPCDIRLPAPLLGQHNDEMQRWSQCRTADESVSRQPGLLIEGRLPLEGVRVIDFGWVWAGAVCGQILADFGAEVIKVESMQRLDPARQGRPIIGDKPDPEQNPLFHNVNRNKLSVRLNLARPEGVALVKQLIAKADVVVENMTPHAMPALGLGYEQLRELKPDLIMVSYPLAGIGGPFSELRGYGPTAASLSGVDSLVGYPGERVIGFDHPYGDPNAGLHAACAALAALYYRQATGEGQHVDCSMWEAMVGTIAYPIMDYIMNGRVALPQGNFHPRFAPYGIYPCRGDDQWLCIVVPTEEEWLGFCNALGHPAWTRLPAFADQASRVRNYLELNRHIADWSRQHTALEAAQLLQAHRVAATPCLDVEDRFVNEHLIARENFVFVDHPILGSEPIYGIPYKLSKTPGQVKRRAPLMGEHNDYVFRELLGLTEAEVKRLKEEKTIF